VLLKLSLLLVEVVVLDGSILLAKMVVMVAV
jgi:hypothetical protein